jgi:PKD repeat protein
MQKFLLIFIILLHVTFMTSYSQTDLQWDCADNQVMEMQRLSTPGFNKLEQDINEQLNSYIRKNLISRTTPLFEGRLTADSIYTIPVVIHIIYPAGEAYGTGTNISYAQIRSQMEALNAAFSKNYPAYNGQTHPAYAQDTRIRFCLARTPAPSNTSWANGPGGIEYGVKRYADNTGAYNHDMSFASANQLLQITHPSSAHFPFDKYLNIWLVKSIGGGNIMGYAPRPLLPGFPLDGIVMRADIFGDNTTGGNYSLNFGLSQGKVLVHEAGHYLNLYHIFQNGCAGANGPGAVNDACDLNGDLICDIEPASTQNVPCDGTIHNTCTALYNAGTTTLDMIEDYMSYADDDCMNTFTMDQARRMWAVLNLQRQSLWQANNLAATGVLGSGGCIPPYLNALISTNTSVFCVNKAIIFSNPAQGNTATSYQWQFPGGTPSSSSSNSVSVTYSSAGNYKAILTVSDGTNTRKDSLLFAVVTCTLDPSFRFMSHWYFGNFCSLDFSSGVPVQTTTALVNNTMQGESAYPGQLTYVQGTVSLSDSSGNLLFYSNAVSVWNANHQKISTSPIFGPTDINATTGISYIPFPGQPNKYFIAGVYPPFSGGSAGVRFVIVDIVANTVSPYYEFNHPSLPNVFSQFLTVIPHCNGTDYWIITKGHGGDTRFYSFLVTSSGIDVSQAPIISSGFVHRAYGGSGNQLKANRKGDKLILCTPHYPGNRAAALYDFDSRTGEVKNERLVPDITGYNNIQSGTAFSPNGEYFYLMRSTNLSTNGPPYWLFQYRVSDLQYNIISTTGFYFAYPFQPGPDNQLYIVNGYNYLARVSNPDKWGEVLFNGEFIYLKEPSPTIFVGTSLPAFIDAQKPRPTHPDFSFRAVNCSTIRFTSICFDSYTMSWNFGDGSPVQTGSIVTHSYAQPGEYNVTLTISNGSTVFGSVTKKVSIAPLSVNITGPDVVCANGNFPTQYFAPVMNGVSYKWSAIAGNISGPDHMPYVNISWMQLNATGKVELTISKDSCVLYTFKDVNITKGTVIEWTLRDSVCIHDNPLPLVATPAGGVFSGPGVNNNIFSPTIAGKGIHRLSYFYRDEGSCFRQVEKDIKVSACNIPGTSSDCSIILDGIRVTPNPLTDNILVLKSPYALKNIEVFNVAGQKVAQGQLVNNQFSLPVLAHGIYLALVYCPGDNSRRAIVFVK